MREKARQGERCEEAPARERRRGTLTREQDWLRERHGCITASAAPAILGVSPYQSALDLYTEKVGLKPPTDSPQKRRGRALEPAILTLADEEVLRGRGWRLERPAPFTLVRHKTLPWMASTQDGYYVRKDGTRGLIEVKSEAWEPQVAIHSAPSPAHYSQCQHALEVTDLDEALLVVLVGGMALKHCLISRDLDFIASLLIHEEGFRQRLKHRNPPPPDDSVSAAKALALLYPETEDTVTELSEEAESTWLELEAVRKTVRELEKERRRLGSRLRFLMGQSRYGLFPSGKMLERISYTQRIQSRTVTRLQVVSSAKRNSLSG